MVFQYLFTSPVKVIFTYIWTPYILILYIYNNRYFSYIYLSSIFTLQTSISAIKYYVYFSLYASPILKLLLWPQRFRYNFVYSLKKRTAGWMLLKSRSLKSWTIPFIFILSYQLSHCFAYCLCQKLFSVSMPVFNVFLSMTTWLLLLSSHLFIHTFEWTSK